MTDDTEVIVDIEPDKPAADETTQVQVEKVEAQKAEVDPAIAELKRQHDELKARDERREAELRTQREAAQRAREEAHRAKLEAEHANMRATDSELDTVESGISASKAEAEAARRAYRAAMEVGDFDAAAAAQEHIAEAASRKILLEQARAQIAASKAERPKQEPRRAADDPFEQYLGQFTAPTRNWLRDHPEWITDQRKNAKLQAAHYDALDAGHTADTPEYFEAVETAIGLREKPANSHANGNGAVEVKAHTRAARKPPVTAAPVQSSGGGTSGGGGTVTLTRSEAAAATDGTLVWNYSDPSGQNRFKKGDPIGVQEFARRKLEMQRQGLYDKSLTEQ